MVGHFLEPAGGAGSDGGAEEAWEDALATGLWARRPDGGDGGW